jgi:uncharacterized protein
MSDSELLALLDSEFTEPIRDPLWGNVFLSPAFEALASSAPFARLDRIKQLGPAYLVYPGATHTRKAHSIGVYHVARRMAWALALRGEIGFVSREGLLSFLVAALCHDLGHFPFAHSLKELALERHEALAARLIEAEPLRSLIGAAGADPDAAAAIVDASRSDRGDRQLRFFRGLLSGVLDPDKLDYLNRDAFFCGVPYGAQDTDFILQRIRVGVGDRLCVEEGGLMSVEGILFSKYLMYRSVYWHKRVRSATAMIGKSVQLGLESSALAPDDLYRLDDSSFYAALASVPFEPFALARSVFEGTTYGVALDLPCDDGDPRHRALADARSRRELEAELAAASGLGPLDVVVDLPEGISFELGLPILPSREAPGDERGRAGPEGRSVFGESVVEGFVRALKRIRVFARPAGGRGRLAEAAEAALA